MKIKNHQRFECYYIIILIICACFCEYYEAFTIIEDQTLSIRQLLRASIRKIQIGQSRNVVLVSMDDEYYETIQKKPINRSDLSLMIENIHQLGPKLIVVNLLMKYPGSPIKDAILKELLSDPAYDNVILASHIEFKKGSNEKILVYPSESVRAKHTTTGYVNIISPCSVVTFLSRLHIHSDIANDLSLIDGWPLAIQAAKKYWNVSAQIDNYVLSLGNHIFQLDHNNDLYIDYSPVPRDSQFLNDYMGLTASAFLTLHYPKNYQNAEHFLDNADPNLMTIDELNLLELLFWIKDKIVVIGDTSIDTRDWFDTPVGTMYGSEIVADTISTLINDSDLRPASLLIEWVVAILMLFLIFWSVAHTHRVIFSFFIFISINLLFTVVCSVLYISYGYIITMTYNYLFGILTFFAATLYYRSIDAKKRKKASLELKNKKISLEKAETKFQNIFENAIEGIFQMDESGSIFSINPSALNILGYESPEEMKEILRDRGNLLYVEKTDQQKIFQMIQKYNIVNGFETRMFRKDGSWIWVSLFVRGVRNDDNELEFYEGSFLDITENKKRADTERQAEAAKAAMKSRSEILASMSHELRTPLNAILGMANILKESNLSHDQKNYVEVFSNAGEHLLVLINDVLSLSRLESGSIKLTMKPFDLIVFVETIKGIMSMQKRQKDNVMLKYNVQPGIPTQLIGDKIRIQQITTNLIDNALKFTQKGSITLSISSDPFIEFENTTLPVVSEKDIKLYFFQIKDTGIGIPLDKQQSIFDTFCQVNHEDKEIGTGLGLTICKRLVESMEGKIILKSEPGKGSTFSFVIPIKMKKMDEPETIVEPDAILKPLKILLVEDNANNQMVFSIFLNDTDHHIDIANNGEEGLHHFKNNHYDIVFMDLQMPVMDGFDASRLIREWEKEKKIKPTPIIAISAQTFLYRKNKAIDAGCTDFIEKPLKKEILLGILQKYCASES
jgi:PAS domain S-box-containing protein